MKIKIAITLLLSCFAFNAIAQDEAVSDEDAQYIKWATELWDSMELHTGEVKIDAANAVLNVPEDFYFLNAQDSEKVLVEIWGNPPGHPSLGMLFPADVTPFDEDSWAVTIDYEEDGYVSDENAASLDFDDMLKQMKADTKASNEYRLEQGFGTIELVGWASAPYYDTQAKKLHWAKELKFDGAEANTLNYNVRVLGRKGVLVLNFIADMSQKDTINANVDDVMAMASFEDGSRYSDFDPSVDKVAAYGIGALVAGKVLAKTGFLAVALIFLKKFGIYLLIGVGLLGKTLFSRFKSSKEA